MSPPVRTKLPLELLHYILLMVVTKSIHCIGTRCGTQWDIQVFTTISKVSTLFDDIAHELIRKIFGPVDGDGVRSIIDDAEKLMNQFHQLGKPEEWPEVASNYPKQYPSHVFNAYALLTSAIYLRQSATSSSVWAFLATQDAARTALRQVKHWPIATREIASALHLRCSQEMELLDGGIALVRGCQQVESLLDELPASNGGPLDSLPREEEEAKYTALTETLRTIETAATKYDEGCVFVETKQPRAVELPGVVQTLCKVFCRFNDNQSPSSASSTKNLLSHWMTDCSFLKNLDLGYPISFSFIY